MLLRWNRSMAMRRMSTSHRCDCARRMKDGTFSSTATVAPGLIFYALSAATKSASSRAFISLIHGNCRLPCLMRLSFRIGHMLNHLQPPAAYMRHCVCGVAESLACCIRLLRWCSANRIVKLLATASTVDLVDSTPRALLTTSLWPLQREVGPIYLETV